MTRFGHLSSEAHVEFLLFLVRKGYVPVVEFGTFTGRTTRRLAEAGATVHTVDIGRDSTYGDYVMGYDWLGMDDITFSRVTPYIGDSREVDLSHLYGTIGLVFVDGGHSYEVVKHDSLEAFKLIRPGGAIVWDDINEDWPGVVRAVNDVCRGLDLRVDRKLSMAVYGWDGK